MSDWQVPGRAVDPMQETDVEWLARRHSEKGLLIHNDLVFELAERKQEKTRGGERVQYVLTLRSGITPDALDYARSHRFERASHDFSLPTEDKYPDTPIRQAVGHVLRVRAIEALLKDSMDAIHKAEKEM
jgi:hypothetical protein